MLRYRPRYTGWMLGLCGLMAGLSQLAAEWEDLPEIAWGEVREAAAETGVVRVAIVGESPEARLPLPTPFPHLARVLESTGSRQRTAAFEFNADATELAVVPSTEFLAAADRQLVLETAEHSQQFPDGRIVLSATDAIVAGTSAQLEHHPGNDRIGYWTNADDWVSWEFDATRWGMYRVWLTYSTASSDGSEIEVRCGDLRAAGTLVSTGSWYRYQTLDLGTLYFPDAGRKSLSVHCTQMVGGAVMNLKAVILEPACEGTPPAQADDGSITLHGRDATVRGTVLRYEPAEAKQTLGYWVNPRDRAEWTFTISEPGTFEVEVLQGCGTDQGGSDMMVRLGDESLAFVVEETGHFQNFRPRVIGEITLPAAGEYTLSVQPERIAKSAACDIRQITLKPVR
jgi:hypothetical protein